MIIDTEIPADSQPYWSPFASVLNLCLAVQEGCWKEMEEDALVFFTGVLCLSPAGLKLGYEWTDMQLMERGGTSTVLSIPSDRKMTTHRYLNWYQIQRYLIHWWRGGGGGREWFRTVYAGYRSSCSLASYPGLPRLLSSLANKVGSLGTKLGARYSSHSVTLLSHVSPDTEVRSRVCEHFASLHMHYSEYTCM